MIIYTFITKLWMKLIGVYRLTKTIQNYNTITYTKEKKRFLQILTFYFSDFKKLVNLNTC